MARTKKTAKANKTIASAAPPSPPRDLSKGVIVVLSGGGFDAMNPVEVRNRMDQYIADVNADPSCRSTPAARASRSSCCRTRRRSICIRPSGGRSAPPSACSMRAR